MSSTWSLYVVPDHWTLMDCMVMGYMTRSSLMVNDDERSVMINHEQEKQTQLYDEILDQPHIYGFACDDCGTENCDEILDVIGLFGRLYPFPDEAYKLIPKLKAFFKKHYGKRFMCLN